MSNLIDTDFRTSCASALSDIFDTFARNVTFTAYKTPEETIIALDSNFNSDWDQNNPWSDSNSTYQEVSETFPVRIWYLDYEQQVKSLFLEGKVLEGPSLRRDIQRIKIQVKQEGYDFIKQSSKCYVLNEYWNIKSSEKAVGLFDFDYYIFFLERAD